MPKSIYHPQRIEWKQEGPLEDRLRNFAGSLDDLFQRLYESQIDLTKDVTGVLPSANGGSLIKRVTVQLTDAQIKALPTTPVTILPAPGVGFSYNYLKARHVVKVVTAYANQNVNGYAVITTPSENRWFGSLIPNDNVPNPALVYLTIVLTTVRTAIFDGLAYQNISTSSVVNDWGPIPDVNIPLSSLDNQPMQLLINNKGSGNLTGGGAQNFWRITVDYSVEALT